MIETPEVSEVTLPNGYIISDDRDRLDMDFVHTSLATVNWSAGQPRALIDRSWSNCLCFGIYSPDGGQVGFGRLLTDYAFRAHLADVFVHPASRGLGLGKTLVETMLAHPNLTTVTQWTLTTEDAQSLYARYGFHVGEADGKWMVLKRTPSREGL
jgi:GNAT superfamily N-acetyltransferase